MSISFNDTFLDIINSTSTNTTVEERPFTVGYTVFNFVLIIFLLIPVILLNVIVIIFVLCRDTTTPKHLRLILANILISCTVVAVGLLLYHTTGLYLAFSLASPPASAWCRFIIGLIAAGGSLRLLFMMAFSITVFLLVREVKFSKMFAMSIAGSCIIWLLGIASALPIAFEDVLTAGFAEGISCGPAPHGPVSVAYALLYAILFGVLCSVVTVTVLVITVCYICKKTIRDAAVSKGLVKLGFFLLVGNFIAFLGQIVPVFVSTLGVTEEEKRTQMFEYLVEVVYATYALINLSLVPPIVLMMVYFNPLRKEISSAVCKLCRKTRSDGHYSVSLQAPLSAQTKDFESPM